MNQILMIYKEWKATKFTDRGKQNAFYNIVCDYCEKLISEENEKPEPKTDAAQAQNVTVSAKPNNYNNNKPNGFRYGK